MRNNGKQVLFVDRVRGPLGKAVALVRNPFTSSSG